MNVLAQPPLFWEAFFLIVCRVGTIMIIAPIFGNRSAPTTLRIAFALLTSLVLLPVATANLTSLPQSLPEFVGMVANQILIGAIVGFAILIIFISLQAAGHIVGMQMGFSLANVVNPLTADQASILDQFYALLAGLIFLTINGHHAVLLGAQQTFDLVPLSQTSVSLPPVPLLLGLGRDMFVIASRMAMPVMAALLLADVALAMIGRSVPQLNVFVVGLPAKVIAGFGIMIIILPISATIMTRIFAGIQTTIATLVRGM